MDKDSLQEDLDTLLDIINKIKSTRQKNLAITILSKLIGVINGQDKEILSLYAWKTNNKISNIECELQKYVLILIIYGYSQNFIEIIRPECLEFVAKHRKEIDIILNPDEIKNIDFNLIGFELEKDRLPNNYKELKNFLKDATKD